VPRILGASAVTLVGGAVMTAGQTVQAATHTVTNTDADGPGSLFQALLDAKDNDGPDTITFDQGVIGTITLTVPYINFDSPYLPVINDDLTITGPGSGVLTIDADNYICDVFSTYRYADGAYLNYDANVVISGLTIANAFCDAIDIEEETDGGSSLTASDLVITSSEGSAIEFTGSSLSLTNVTLTGSDAYGVYATMVGSASTVTITDSTITYNGYDGVDLNGPESGGSATITDSTISNNENNGVDSDYVGAVSVTGSTFSDNDSDGLDVDEATSVAVSTVTATGNGQSAAKLTNVRKATVSSLTATGNGFSPDYYSGLDARYIETLTITDSTFTGNYENGIDLYSVAAATVTNTTANDNRYNGLEFDSNETWSTSISITNSTFSGNYYSGIDGDDVDDLTLTNVTANDNGNYGVYVEQISSVTVTDSTVTGNGDDGLKLDDVYVSVVITDVAATGNDEAGVELEDIRSGSVTVTRLTANDNGEDGLYLDETHDPDIGTTIVDSTFDGNAYGVRVWLASADVDRVTISNSTSDGIIGLGASITVTNSTVTSSGGDGIRLEGQARYVSFDGVEQRPTFDYVGSDVTVEHSTITGNTGAGVSATEGGTVYLDNPYEFQTAQDITIENSIVSGNGDVDVDNASENNVSPDQGTTSVTWSLVDEGSTHTGTGNVEADDPKLGDLADNGGDTLTMLPADDSPAISAGNPAITGTPATDQRGVNRIVNRLEIGAVEVDVDQGTITVLPPSGAGEATGITVPVTRSGAAEGPTSITLRSCDGVTRTLSWADGEAGTKTATFPFTDNATDDPDRTCTIEIVSRTGADAGIVASWPVTVTDLEDSPAELPATGSSGALAWMAAAVLGIGTAMSRTARRRTN
jgi:hypothetical protein